MRGGAPLATVALAAVVVAIVCTTGGTAAAPARCAGVKDAGLLVARARQAVGSGTHKLVSFTAKGPNQPTKPTAEPVVTEIAVILPDKFVQINRPTEQWPVTYVNGFNGTALLTDVRGPTPGFINAYIGPPTPAKLEASRRSLAQLLMGWFLLPLPGVRETFRYSGEVVYRDRPAVVLLLVDSPVLLRRVWLDRDSCLPLGLVYELPKGLKEEADTGASAPALARFELAFFDRRVTSGFRVAYQVRTFDWLGRPRGHWNIERFEINGKVDADLFRPPKR